MSVFALYNFNDATTVVDDAALHGDQFGRYINTATAEGGDLVLDGVSGFAKIYPVEEFNLPRGTLEINFTPTDDAMTGAQTVLSRDSVGENQGSYRIEIHPDGAITVTHEVNGDATVLTSGPGFYSAGDTINLSYSWDVAGTDGRLVIDNQTTGANHTQAVPAGLTMEMTGQNQPWLVGTDQSESDPDLFNNLDQYFKGSVEFFSLSDSIDNTIVDEDPVANPDHVETAEDTAVVVSVLDNDTDPNGDALQVTSAVALHGSIVINADGTLGYTPNADYTGSDTITYTITDPTGHTASSTVAVTVTPVNDAPVASPDAQTTAMDTPVVIAVLSNDSDVDHDQLSVVGTPLSPDGTVVVNADGTLTFTPTAGFTGVTSFDYTISDGQGGTATSTVTVTVEPVRDGIVRGTNAGDMIDFSYVDQTDGDRIDAGDALFPGDGPNDDRVVAGEGSDTVLSAMGNDTVDGGNGGDLIDTSGDATPLPDIDYPGYYAADDNPDDDHDVVYAGLGNDTVRTGDDADTIHADQGDDLVDAGFDADLVFGGDGHDTLVGGEGADTIDGGAGNDLIYGGLNDGIADALDIPNDAGDLRPDNNTDLITGGAGDDTIFGRDDDDTIDGGDGNDLIDGGVDEDSILGGAGNDTITGSHGADNSAGGDDRDVFVVGTQGQGQGDFIDGSEGGNDFDTLDLRGAGPLSIAYDPANPENGVVTFRDGAGNPAGTLNFVNIENVIPCFTPGTLIATPRGEVPVERLQPGDRVITRDNGIQEIRWVGQKAVTGHELMVNNHLQPVLVKAHALGNGLPERDMLVSPNHRLLVANDRTQLYFDEHEVLVAAKHLAGTSGVHAVNSIGVTYIHFMCDRHEVVLSNGAWTESFQPGDMTLKGMGNAQRNEIFELFPELKTEDGLDGYTAARRTLKRHEAKLLTK